MSPNLSRLSGSLVALATPMRADGAVDYDAFAALLEWHIAQGTNGVVIAGTTGESPTLGMQEHQQLIAKAAQLVNGRVAVVAGVGANSTAEAVELAKQAQADGADAGLSVTPYYNKPPQEGLYRHYAAVAEATELPLLLYDVPGRCGVGVEDSTVCRLAQLPGIVGIKDATGNMARPPALRAALAAAGAEGFLLLSGDDKTALPFLLLGGDGVVSVTANIAPRAMRRMVALARAGKVAEARRLDSQLFPFHLAQAAESNPVPVKAALAMLKRAENALRLPLTPLAKAHVELVRAALANAQAAEEEIDE